MTQIIRNVYKKPCILIYSSIEVINLNTRFAIYLLGLRQVKLPSWKTAGHILKGKAKGSKLIVLGIFLVITAVAIHISTGNAQYGAPLLILGAFAFANGLVLYNEEARYELERKKSVSKLSRS